MGSRRPVNKVLDDLSTAVSTLSFEEGFEEEEALLGGGAPYVNSSLYATMEADDRRSAAFEETEHPAYHPSQDMPPPPPPDSVRDFSPLIVRRACPGAMHPPHARCVHCSRTPYRLTARLPHRQPARQLVELPLR
jgi:hypothetical protein